MIRHRAQQLRDVAAKAALRRSDPAGSALVSRVLDEELSFLDFWALIDLRRRAQELERAGVAGSIVEAGCALGGSAIVLAASKSPARPMTVHDVFGVIPPPGEKDDADVHARYATIAAGEATGFGGDVYYGYQPDLKGKVTEAFARLGYPVEQNGVELVEGYFQDTIRPTAPVALAHVDGDWYESVKVCLDRLWPALSRGGVLVIDDYDAWSGCRTAVDEFLAGRSDAEVQRRSRLHLVKR